ncbi:hypothetical protein E2C01_073953 [Portunus trituberculatus]|uniref:Uncharacterized protein n=1 Tax=Portunus trituberculatus TaxID=210409 RepID=A0A5B7IB37_PORTR|nr:hypothetical protein [Portunus trituberculatus]
MMMTRKSSFYLYFMAIRICFFMFSLRGKMDPWGLVLPHHFVLGRVKIIIL